jgi:hypothetical protein
MKKNTTALNRAIQRAKDQHNYYAEESLKDEYTDREKELLYVKSIALAEFIDTLAELLPVEASQLDDAVCHGWSYEYNTKGMMPLDDYSHKYLLETYGIDYDQMMKQAYTQK